MASGDNAAIVPLLSPPESLFELVPSTEPDGKDISHGRYAMLFLDFPFVNHYALGCKNTTVAVGLLTVARPGAYYSRGQNKVPVPFTYNGRRMA